VNPLNWKREHQLAWLLTCALGGVVGLFTAFWRTEWAATYEAGQTFPTWLGFPLFYWPWPMFGVVIAGLLFYIVKLLKA
jgi:hypothetical protein